ncbi:glycosyltransferase [Cryobacterium sp. 5B3]|uniref:glycosyltransferase n=1 Tax=Cryobacterium sp. 5B3 TaxID=3048586 RepID=UPI002AB3F142|nr:glycosyltransferase [Cryobacterium sp. 5B3]MDY7540916.1 glycosyltransferase [Cryobacterium sp. 5B3]MEB0276139.1 glycosyltransferase [Cryobacterium sp. 5B3]
MSGFDGSGDSLGKSVAIIGTRGYPSYYGGFETAVRKLAPYLVENGWAVTVYGRRGSTKDDDPTRDSRVRTVVTHGIEKKSLSTLTYGLTASLHAIFNKPDVALVMNVANGFWIPLLRIRGIPVVVNVDGIEWDRAKWGKLAKLVFRLGARFTALFGTSLISDAEEIRRRWMSDFHRDSKFIPYGGDFSPELPLPQELGLDDRRYVLVVARFVPENTIPEFFDAVSDLAKDNMVVIVGSSGYGGELDDLARELDQRLPKVSWLGHVRDDKLLVSLWQHAGVYFHGHSVGGTNPSLVQAMACGAPIVALDTPYNREVLGERGRFTSRLPDEISKSIRDVLNNSGVQLALSTGAQDRARSEYSWKNVLGAYDTALQTAIQHPGNFPRRNANTNSVNGGKN